MCEALVGYVSVTSLSDSVSLHREAITAWNLCDIRVSHMCEALSLSDCVSLHREAITLVSRTQDEG